MKTESIFTDVDAVLAATGIDTADCSTCAHKSTDDDGSEYSCESWDICTKYEAFNNLTSFPFKKRRGCWVPEFWVSKFPNLIKIGESEEVSNAISEFKNSFKKYLKRQT